MCSGGGGSRSAPAPAPAIPAAAPVIQEEVIPDVGIDPAETKRKAQKGKRDLRVNIGSLDPETIGAGVTSGINLG